MPGIFSKIKRKRIGQVKVDKGKKYKLNENYRWERAFQDKQQLPFHKRHSMPIGLAVGVATGMVGAGMASLLTLKLKGGAKLINTAIANKIATRSIASGLVFGGLGARMYGRRVYNRELNNYDSAVRKQALKTVNKLTVTGIIGGALGTIPGTVAGTLAGGRRLRGTFAFNDYMNIAKERKQYAKKRIGETTKKILKESKKKADQTSNYINDKMKVVKTKTKETRPKHRKVIKKKTIKTVTGRTIGKTAAQKEEERRKAKLREAYFKSRGQEIKIKYR
jgi:hypothetical protein